MDGERLNVRSIFGRKKRENVLSRGAGWVSIVIKGQDNYVLYLDVALSL